MRRLLPIVFIFLFGSQFLYSQGVTTGSIAGIITDQKGEGLPDANIPTLLNQIYLQNSHYQGKFC